MKKKIILTVLLATLSFVLISCKTQNTAVMTYGESSITDKEFTYWLSTYKYMFANTYENFEDTHEYYAKTLSDGTTYEEKLFEIAVQNIKASLISAEEFDSKGFELTDEAKSKVDEYIDGLIEKAGDKTALNASLSSLGVNCDILREIYIKDAKGSLLQSKLFEEDGGLCVTDEDREEYYNNSYVHFRHIYVNNKYEYETDDSGAYVYDDDGNVKKTELTGKALEEKNEKIKSIDKALSDGEDFYSVYEKYSEDRYYDESGYYLTAEMDFFTEVLEAAFSLEEGEYKKVESDAGTHYIQRMVLEDKAYENEENSDFFNGYDDTVKSYLFEKYISEKMDKVEVNEDILSSFSIENAKINPGY